MFNLDECKLYCYRYDAELNQIVYGVGYRNSTANIKGAVPVNIVKGKPTLPFMGHNCNLQDVKAVFGITEPLEWEKQNPEYKE